MLQTEVADVRSCWLDGIVVMSLDLQSTGFDSGRLIVE